jgi:hypothetical protein
MIVPAARTLQRRIRAQQLYRVRRDRKIAVDWIGRDFEYQGINALTGILEPLMLKLVSYNPYNHMIRLIATGRDRAVVGDVVWDTDRLWSLLRTGRLLRS